MNVYIEFGVWDHVPSSSRHQTIGGPMGFYHKGNKNSSHCRTLNEGFHSHGGTPKWRVYRENSIKMDDDWGYPYDLGHPQILVCEL